MALVLLLATAYAATIGGVALYNAGVTSDNCATRASTNFGDGTAGAVWFSYLFDTGQVGPGDGFETLTGPRGGEQAWTPEAWTQTLTMAPMWAATRVVGPVCALNLTLGASFAISALSMAVLAFYLTRRLGIAAVAGYLFGFSALAVAKSTGHIAYVNQWPFALLVLGVIWAWRTTDTARPIVLAAVGLGIAPWVDGYYLVFSWITFSVLALSLVVFDRAAGAVWPQVTRLAKAAALGLALQLPLIWLVMGRGADSSGPARPFTDAVGEFDNYGARPQDFITADGRSVFSGLVKPRAGFIEANVYLGIPVLVVALIGLGLWLRRPSPSAGTSGRPHSLVAATLFSAVLLAYMCGPARPKVFGVELPNPFGILVNYLPLWRVPSRMGIAVVCLVMCAAALAANALIAMVSGKALRIVVAVAMIAFVALDHIDDSAGYQSFDYSQAPPGYRWLATLPSVGRIVEYPTTDPDGGYSTFQLVHRKHLVNAKVGSDGGTAMNEAIAGLADRQTAPLLRAFGVDMVVAHPMKMQDNDPLGSADVRLVNRFDESTAWPGQTDAGRRQVAALATWYRMDIYKVTPGPVATGYLEFDDGWFPQDVGGYHTQRWAALPSARVIPRSLVGSDACRVSLDVSSFGPERLLTVRQSGAEVWAGRTKGLTDVTFDATCDDEVTLSTVDPFTSVKDVDPSSGDPRSLGLGVGASSTESLPSP